MLGPPDPPGSPSPSLPCLRDMQKSPQKAPSRGGDTNRGSRGLSLMVAVRPTSTSVAVNSGSGEVGLANRETLVRTTSPRYLMAPSSYFCSK